MNNVHRVNLSGGILGALASSSRSSLEGAIEQANSLGEEVVFIIPDTTNFLQEFARFVILLLTLLMWCPARGYLVVTRRAHAYRLAQQRAAEPASVVAGGTPPGPRGMTCPQCEAALAGFEEFCGGCGASTGLRKTP